MGDIIQQSEYTGKNIHSKHPCHPDLVHHAIAPSRKAVTIDDSRLTWLVYALVWIRGSGCQTTDLVVGEEVHPANNFHIRALGWGARLVGDDAVRSVEEARALHGRAQE